MEENIQYLIENNIATEDEITLVCNIVGHTQEALENILYARTGYRSLEQLREEDGDE